MPSHGVPIFSACDGGASRGPAGASGPAPRVCGAGVQKSWSSRARVRGRNGPPNPERLSVALRALLLMGCADGMASQSREQELAELRRVGVNIARVANAVKQSDLCAGIDVVEKNDHHAMQQETYIVLESIGLYPWRTATCIRWEVDHRIRGAFLRVTANCGVTTGAHVVAKCRERHPIQRLFRRRGFEAREPPRRRCVHPSRRHVLKRGRLRLAAGCLRSLHIVVHPPPQQGRPSSCARRQRFAKQRALSAPWDYARTRAVSHPLHHREQEDCQSPRRPPGRRGM